MARIAVYIRKYSIGKSSPVICLLDLLAERYEAVDVYAQDVWYTNASVLKRENVRLIEVPGKGKGLLGRVFKLFPKFLRRERYVNDYAGHICFDPNGLLLCNEVFPAARPIYYSLELYFKDNYFNLVYPQEVINRERALINSIKGLIIQSEEREYLFRKEYELTSDIPVFLLPVTYLHTSCREKRQILRDKYGISNNKKVVLHLGGIQEYHSCIEIALTFSMIVDCVLIFHGYYFGEYIERLRNTISDNNISNVIISDEAYELIEDMDQLLMSCDIGIAWYNDVSPNFSTAGKSSGKISAYLRFGLPVIAKRYPSSLEAIEKTSCGVCVDDFDGIPEAVRIINENYDHFSDNCRREYDAVYWFENYRERLIEFIEQEEGSDPLAGRQ